MKINISKEQWLRIGQLSGWVPRKQEMIGFNFDASVKIFVEPFELEMESEYDSIVNNNSLATETKISELKELAFKVAQQKLLDKEVQIDENNLSMDSMNMDTVDWEKIINPENI